VQPVRRPGAGQRCRREGVLLDQLWRHVPHVLEDRCQRTGKALLYAWLTEQATQPDGPGDIKWNFAKFVVGRNGKVLARFAPPTSPSAPEVRQSIESALGG
jgi:glutathione peroxidase-family protein